MRRSGWIIGLVVLALSPGATAPAAPWDGARLTLLSRSEVRTDVERYHYRYGPLVAGPGQNAILLGPAPLGELATREGFVVRTAPNLVRADGVPPPVDVVHMHHAVFLNLSRADATAPRLPERFFAYAEEKTIGTLPEPYGYHLRPSDTIAVNYMLHNGTAQTESVYIDLIIDFVPAASDLGRRMKPVRPLWLDVENGKAYPVFDALRGTGRGGRFTYPDDAGDPYRGGPRRNEWKVDRDGVLVAGAAHLHPGGLWVDLDLRRGDRSTRLFRSEANYFDPRGPISWDLAMDHTPTDWRAAVRAGDVLAVRTTYESERASWYESMGIFLVYLAEDGGPDPFVAPPPRDGEPTHGHLPEAGNYGGEPGSLADPAGRPDGQAVAGGVGIGNFLYWPGDLSLSGAAGAPPVLQPGEELEFGNFDAAAGIPHTITSCRPPCTARTGISYPLADGPVTFDSGQLGYGPDGFTAAAQRADWRIPKDLAPGTYTYFCRVHPFMRGAFRVAGTPASSTGGEPSRAPSRGRPPAPRLVVADRVLRARRGRVALRARCRGTRGCRGRVTLTGRRGRVLARGTYALRAGRAGTVRLRLTPAGRRVAARTPHRGAAVRLRVAPREGRGATWRVRLAR